MLGPFCVIVDWSNILRLTRCQTWSLPRGYPPFLCFSPFLTVRRLLRLVSLGKSRPGEGNSGARTGLDKAQLWLLDVVEALHPSPVFASAAT